MQHDLGRVLLGVELVALAPVVAHSIGKDRAVLIESSSRDASADVGVSLEAVLCVLVPEVERTIGASRAEGAVDGVERDVVDRIDIGHVV